jgi:hypothetical protein
LPVFPGCQASPFLVGHSLTCTLQASRVRTASFAKSRPASRNRTCLIVCGRRGLADPRWRPGYRRRQSAPVLRVSPLVLSAVKQPPTAWLGFSSGASLGLGWVHSSAVLSPGIVDMDPPRGPYAASLNRSSPSGSPDGRLSRLGSFGSFTLDSDLKGLSTELRPAQYPAAMDTTTTPAPRQKASPIAIRLG